MIDATINPNITKTKSAGRLVPPPRNRCGYQTWRPALLRGAKMICNVCGAYYDDDGLLAIESRRAYCRCGEEVIICPDCYEQKESFECPNCGCICRWIDMIKKRC